MRKITPEDRKRIAEKNKPKPVVVETKKPKSVDNREVVIAKAQVEATLELARAVLASSNSVQLTEVIKLLSQPVPETPKQNKRLTVNRGSNNLIQSIDIEEI